MANTDSAKGFVYDTRLSDEHPPIMDYEMAESTTLSDGDPVTIENGYVRLAASGEPVLGVVIGSIYPGWDGSYDSGAGEHPAVKICIALEDVLFRVHDANAAPTIALRGASVDMVGASGVVGVDSTVVANGDFMLWDRAWADSISGNVWGPDMQWLGSFQNRYMSKV